MLTALERAREAADAIRSRTSIEARAVLILGSGLGGYAARVQDATVIPYTELPGFLPSGVEGHAGRLVLGVHRGLPLAIFQGRIHAYEGHSMEDVVHPLRCAWALGARTLVVTNAAGSLHQGLQPGDLMLLRDHINLTGRNPLVGPNDPRMGPRFPDMTEVYTPALRAIAHAAAQDCGLHLEEGVYISVLGPTYETPAEVHMLHRLGGDTVGMSTVPEVIAARHLGMEVLGLSCVTNLGAGLSGEALHHDEVQLVADRVKDGFAALMDGICARLAQRSAP